MCLVVSVTAAGEQMSPLRVIHDAYSMPAPRASVTRSAGLDKHSPGPSAGACTFVVHTPTLRRRGSARFSGTAVVSAIGLLVLAAAAALVPTASAAVATQVYGYCQGGKQATFTGGFNVSADTKDACHRGMFGSVPADGSLFPRSYCSSSDDPDGDGDWSTCTCLGFPQCTEGETCTYDCGCAVRNASQINSYFNANPKLSFSGVVTYDAGAVTVACDAYKPAGQFVHGYTLTVAGYKNGLNPTVACDSIVDGPAAPGNWTCVIDLELSSSALEPGSSFKQEVFVRAYAPRTVAGVVTMLGTALAVWWLADRQ